MLVFKTSWASFFLWSDILWLNTVMTPVTSLSKRRPIIWANWIITALENRHSRCNSTKKSQRPTRHGLGAGGLKEVVSTHLCSSLALVDKRSLKPANSCNLTTMSLHVFHYSAVETNTCTLTVSPRWWFLNVEMNSRPRLNLRRGKLPWMIILFYFFELDLALGLWQAKMSN